MKATEDTDNLDLLAEVLPDVLASFRRLDVEGRERLLQTVAAALGIACRTSAAIGSKLSESAVAGRFSQDLSLTPKEFLLQKQPRTDVERVACLGYYLTHYRDTPHFRTLDISKLNTEAAQVKFANAAQAVNNATQYGYLAPATKGNKQLSAAGELFVQALPDHEAAKVAMTSARPRRKVKRQRIKDDSRLDT